MAEKKPYAYRLQRVVPQEGFSMGTAALMSCMVTGETLSSSGGGGDYISPAVYALLSSDPEVQDLIRQKIAAQATHSVA